jgi:recombination protein RecR
LEFGFSILDWQRSAANLLPVPKSKFIFQNPPSKIQNLPAVSALDRLQQQLRQLPGLGPRSAERIALHLLVEQPAQLPMLVAALQAAAQGTGRCTRCGHLAEAELCGICADPRRDASVVCVVEHVPDLVALERAGNYRGAYHVLHGKLSPINGVGPEQLNVVALHARVAAGEVAELILALANDVEGEATCHYLTQQLTAAAAETPGESGANPPGGVPVALNTPGTRPALRITRIGFGLPSGAGVLHADPVTLKSALDGRRAYA